MSAATVLRSLRALSLRASGAALLAGVALPAAAAGVAVSLAGVLGGKALLVVDGQARPLAPGESLSGVRLISVGRDEAVVEIGGQRGTLQLGGAPSRVGAASPTGGGRRIVMVSDGGGHFHPQGSINGQVVQFIVDTGATAISIGQADAERLSLPFHSGEPVRMSTANGIAQGWRLKLSSVRIGDVELHEVDAVVTPQAMPYVLLGNTFLNQFQMTRINDQMTLEKK